MAKKKAVGKKAAKKKTAKAKARKKAGKRKTKTKVLTKESFIEQWKKSMELGGGALTKL